MGKTFQISTRWSGRLRTIKVCVYDTQADMLEAVDKYDKATGKWEEPEIGYKNTYGVTQGLESGRFTTGGRLVKTPFAGYIRLIKLHLRSGLLAHECTHMAVSIYKQDVQKTIPDMEREEVLCYLVSDIMSKLVRKLDEYSLIPR